MNRNGFTLTEVLITLAIIGVVAAMTLPALIDRSQERQFITMWKKSFAEIANACLMLKNEDITFDRMSEQDMTNNLAKYIKHDKVCRANKLVEDGCYKKRYRIYNYLGSEYYTASIDEMGGGAPCILTNRGILICNDANIVYVDVNGDKRPNRIGRDIFSGTIQTKTLVFRPNVGTRTNYGPVDGVTRKPTTGNGTCKNADYGWGCSAAKLLK